MISMNRNQATTVSGIISEADSGEGDVNVFQFQSGLVQVLTHHADGSEYQSWHVDEDGEFTVECLNAVAV